MGLLGATVGAMVGFGAVSVGSAAASSALWNPVSIGHPPGSSGTLSADSCPTVAFCVSVGSALGPDGVQSPLAELWNGSSWQVLATPTPVTGVPAWFTGVSCPSTSWCMAVGDVGDIGVTGDAQPFSEVMVNGTWDLLTTPSPGGSFTLLNGVSCSSAAACTAVGSYGSSSGPQLAFADRWNGGAWTTEVTAQQVLAESSSLNAVSCPSTDVCVAVGSYTNSLIGTTSLLAEEWIDGTWVHEVAIPALLPSEFTGVSCPSTVVCMAVGSGPSGALADEMLGVAWLPMPVANAAGVTLDAVACPTITSCRAVGIMPVTTTANQYGYADSETAETWNGLEWTEVPALPLPSGDAQAGLTGLACPSAASCLAVGAVTTYPTEVLLEGQDVFPNDALADVLRAGAWVPVAPVDPGGGLPVRPGAVSCASDGSCMAVGSYNNGNADVLGLLSESWNGTAWTDEPMPLPPGILPDGDIGYVVQAAAVSCTSATYCVAVGHGGTASQDNAWAALWDGTSWSSSSLALPPGATSLFPSGLSCPAPGECVMVGSAFEDGSYQPFSEVLDATTWSVAPVAIPGGSSGANLGAVSCVNADLCTAVGSMYASGVASVADAVGLTETWNGSQWSVQSTLLAPAGQEGVNLSGVSCTAASSCVAVGWTVETASTSTVVTLTGVWNGTGWSEVPTPDASGNLLESVWCTTASSCEAVGTAIFGWNGTAWTSQVSSVPERLGSVSCTPSGTCAATEQGGFATVPLEMAQV